MPLSEKETRELYEGIGVLKKGISNLEKGQEKLEKKIDHYMVFSGERKYIYGLIIGLYATVISSMKFDWWR